MWTDLVFNLFLLAIASADATSFFFILAVSNCGYIIFNFLNLNAGWIHRIDNGHIARPWRAPTWSSSALGCVLAFVNAMFMGAGAKVWNPMALWAGYRGGADHPGVLVPPLRPGRRQVPAAHARRSRPEASPISPCARRACCPT